MNVAIRHATAKDAPAMQRIWKQRAGTHPALDAWDKERALAKAVHPQRLSVVFELDGKVVGLYVAFKPPQDDDPESDAMRNLEALAVDADLSDEDRDVVFHSLICATAADALAHGRKAVRITVPKGLPVKRHLDEEFAASPSEEAEDADYYVVGSEDARRKSMAFLRQRHGKRALFRRAEPVLRKWTHGYHQELP